MTASAPTLCYLPYESFLSDVTALAQQVRDGGWQPDFVIGIGRGGLVPAVYMSHQLAVPMLSIDHSAKVPSFAEALLGKVAEKSASGVKLLFVDDINDSGGTIAQIRDLLEKSGCQGDNLRFAVVMSNRRSRVEVDYLARMIDRDEDKRWYVFPWEAVGQQADIVAEALSNPERLA